MAMPDTINIGFIGCGGNARGHMETLGAMEDARIVAVCDLVDRLAQKAAELTGAEPTTDMHRMLQRDDLHAVILSLPVFAHGDPERAVIERGLPFLVEKPVARDLATAQRIADEVRRKDLLTCVGYQLRYGGGTTAAKQALAGKTVGLVAGQYWCGTGRQPDNWRVHYETSGGQILEQATHTLDTMRYLCGEVVEVRALRASRELTHIDCADVHAVQLIFESGALGDLTTLWAYDPNDWSMTNVVHISFDDRILRWCADGSTLLGGDEPQTLEGQDKSIERVFVDAVRSGDRSQILSDYDDGVRSLALALAVNQSAEQGGQPVRLG